MDLIGLTTLSSSGWTVVLVEQPWRVAGRSVAPRPVVLDAAWSAVVADLATGPEALPGPVICGGRSAGARVACRTATQVGAQAVIALAFPLHPPGRPGRSRVDELVAVSAAGIPLLVVNGSRDAFGTAEQIRAALASAATRARSSGAVDVVSVEGGHGFTADPRDVVDAVHDWLPHR